MSKKFQIFISDKSGNKINSFNVFADSLETAIHAAISAGKSEKAEAVEVLSESRKAYRSEWAGSREAADEEFQEIK